MYYCKNCGHDFCEPQKIYETHIFTDTPFELIYICPNCKSGNFREKNLTHCRCCGSRLSPNAVEYCSDSCRNRGEKLWQKEFKKRRESLLDPLNTVVRECNIYNLENGTKYSYGQFVALIRPKLLKEQKKCVKQKKNI